MLGIIFTALLLIFIVWILFSYNKTTERKAKAMNMSLFLIKSLEGFDEEADLLNLFRKMHLKGWNRFLYGDPYISLEKIIQPGLSGSFRTEYYIAIPQKYEELLINDPHVSKVEKEVMPQFKQCVAVCLHKHEPRIKFGDIKLYDEEGVILQILARHLHDAPGHFESNIRVLAWADSKERAARILNLQKIKHRRNKHLVFDFFSRIFDNRKRVKISFQDLKNFLINKFAY